MQGVFIEDEGDARWLTRGRNVVLLARAHAHGHYFLVAAERSLALKGKQSEWEI
jgi:hypothetical protein